MVIWLRVTQTKNCNYFNTRRSHGNPVYVQMHVSPQGIFYKFCLPPAEEQFKQILRLTCHYININADPCANVPSPLLTPTTAPL